VTEPNQQIFVLDRDNVMRLWLTDQVAARKLTQAEADVLWRRYSSETRFVANYFAVADDMALITKLIRDLRTPLGRVYFKQYGGKTHIVLKSSPGLRQILTGTRYGVQNPKVIGMGLGRAGVIKSAKGGTIITVFLLTAWNIADYVMRDEATLGQLLGAVAMDITKAAVGGAVGAAAGALVVGTVVGTFALGPLVVAVAVGIGVGLALDWLDNRFQLTVKLQRLLDDALTRFQAEVERQRQGLLDRGAQAVGALVDGLIDLAVTTAANEVRRRIAPMLWRALPRF
jgi:hypothetical protein